MSEEGLGEVDWSAELSEQARTENMQDIISTDVFNEITPDYNETGSTTDLEFILDIPVQLTVELGRTKISIKNLMQLTQGSVIELNGFAGEPLDVLVNGCLIAHGEVVVVNDKYGIRLIDITNPADRLKRVNK